MQQCGFYFCFFDFGFSFSFPLQTVLLVVSGGRMNSGRSGCQEIVDRIDEIQKKNNVDRSTSSVWQPFTCVCDDDNGLWNARCRVCDVRLYVSEVLVMCVYRKTR